MKTLVGLLMLLVTGCATVSPPPPEVAHVQLATKASARLDVHAARLGRDGCGLYVAGTVHRRWGVTETRPVHLDVTVYGSGDAVLMTTVAQLETALVRGGPAALGVSNYRVYLTPEPREIQRVVVRADDGPHS